MTDFIRKRPPCNECHGTGWRRVGGGECSCLKPAEVKPDRAIEAANEQAFRSMEDARKDWDFLRKANRRSED